METEGNVSGAIAGPMTQQGVVQLSGRGSAHRLQRVRDTQSQLLDVAWSLVGLLSLGQAGVLGL